MSSKAEKDRQKAIQDKCQLLLNEMLRDEDNKYCVDCDAKGPRWASWNLGIFLCIRCAGIHRNLGVHISKVKSVNLDTWTPEQVVSLQQMGNSRARAVYEANLPDNFRRPQTDSPLEAFVRAKYEQRKYIAREWVPSAIPKVNWDKEIEEEDQARRRRKENKSSTSQSARAATASPGGHSITSEIPAPLPKPKSSASPKPSRTSFSSCAPATSVSSNINPSATLDLLGLDTPTGNTSSPSKGDDIFCSFLSAPVSGSGSTASAVTTSGSTSLDATKSDAGNSTVDSKRSAEEDSFFNQPTQTAQEKKQLTKDSILALYSTSSPAVPPAQPQAFAGIPGAVFPAQNVAGFGTPGPGMNMGYPMSNGIMTGQSLPATSTSLQNGILSNTIGTQPGMMAAGVAIPTMTSNPFFSMAGGAASQTNSYPVQNQMNQEHGSSSDLLDLGSSIGTTLGIQLPQQMNRLNLASAPVGSAGVFGAGTGQQGMGMPPNVGGNPWASAGQPNMSLAQATFPPNQAPVGHTLATNLWQ